MKKDVNKFIFFLLIIVIIGAIFLINYLKSNDNPEEETMKCIAEKSELFVSKTCGHCASQKQILGEYITYFNIIDCTTNQEKCTSNNILYVPTWIIDDKKYTGKKAISELKELTKC